MTGFGLLVGLCIVLTLLPPKWDPAILWKEHQLRMRDEDEKNRKTSKTGT